MSINNTEDANKYYQLINNLIDKYIVDNGIRPSKLRNYLKPGGDRFNKFLERNKLKDIKGSESFWVDKANMWETTPEIAKSARCKNCSMFNQTKEIMDRIAKGIGPKGKEIVKKADLGYCELFWFKCAGDRTCDAWIVGGPLK